MLAVRQRTFYFWVEIYCAITTALWFGGGQRTSTRGWYGVKCVILVPSSLGGLAHRSGGSLQEETEQDI